MLESFASSVRQGGDNQPEDSSKAKVATFGLKKILDLYLILCNGKNIIDTSNYFNLQRQTDRSQTVPHIFQQFVVELRASILPSISKLWDSSLLEKVPEHTAKRLIEILKLISAADHEPSSTPQDKVSHQSSMVKLSCTQATNVSIETLLFAGIYRFAVQLGPSPWASSRSGE
jgi:E3 ubiquitin-protein ligase HUWE1